MGTWGGDQPAQGKGECGRMPGESVRHDEAEHEKSAEAAPPDEDLFDIDDDPVDFMSAESFPASDPAPPQSENEAASEDG